MKIHERIAVDVIKALPVGVIHIDSQLPGVTPVLHILTGQCIGSLLQVEDDLPHAPLISLGENKIPMGRVYDVVRLWGEAHN